MVCLDFAQKRHLAGYIVILDACRDNPFGKNFRTASRGLAIVSSAPRGTLISYSTSPGKVAADGGSRNSPYTEALVKHMTTPGLQIEEVFKKVRQDIGNKTRGQQIPWELSSLEGEFYFSDQESRAKGLPEAPAYAVNSTLSPDSDVMLREKQAMERERQELERQKAIIAEREHLAEEHRKLEAEKQRLTMLTSSNASIHQEKRRDGRFIAYDNGTVLDTKTNLMWAEKDNWGDINWSNAKYFCENYRGGGYTDWRMPTQDELSGLYDKSKNYKATQRNYNVHLTELIQLSACCSWSSETLGSNSPLFGFDNGKLIWSPKSFSGYSRALPVRSGK